MILRLGDFLREINYEEGLAKNTMSVLILKSEETEEILNKIGIDAYGEISTNFIGFNKVEAHQECMVGTLYIPKIEDVVSQRYRIQIYITEKHIVIVDDNEFAKEMADRIVEKKLRQGADKGMFLFNFFTEFMSRDVEVLGQYEKRLMQIEEDIMDGKLGNCQSELMPIRKRLLILRGYYGEIADVGKELEDNEIGIFDKKELRYFGIINDRAERLMIKTAYLLEYAGQVQEMYQTHADSRQSANMQFLTIISTIFFPLTLITGWYGMNFRNMPELKEGYPGVIVLSVMVVVVCIVIFKLKKII